MINVKTLLPVSVVVVLFFKDIENVTSKSVAVQLPPNLLYSKTNFVTVYCLLYFQDMVTYILERPSDTLLVLSVLSVDFLCCHFRFQLL